MHAHKNTQTYPHAHVVGGMSGSAVPAVRCRQRGVWVKYEPMCPLHTPAHTHTHTHRHTLLCKLISETSGSAQEQMMAPQT